jgi:hypothetical protein
MLRRLVLTGCSVVCVAMIAIAWAGRYHAAVPQGACEIQGEVMRLDGLPEASGLAASRKSPGRLWTHNDSGDPVIHAIDTKGRVAGLVTLTGAALDDWEAIALGPCDSGDCLYIGDIGDNDATRADITIYRVPEPAQASGSANVTGVFRAIYPDGKHDAEALLVAPDGTLHIMTKGDTGSVALYRFPRDLRDDAVMRLERVGEPLSKDKPASDARITDGAVAPDGSRVVLRTKTAMTFYAAADFFKGTFTETGRVDLKPLGEPQGEAVAFGPGNTLFVAGEGGGKSQPGTLAELSCAK